MTCPVCLMEKLQTAAESRTGQQCYVVGLSVSNEDGEIHHHGWLFTKEKAFQTIMKIAMDSMVWSFSHADAKDMAERVEQMTSGE